MSIDMDNCVFCGFEVNFPRYKWIFRNDGRSIVNGFFHDPCGQQFDETGIIQLTLFNPDYGKEKNSWLGI